MKRIVKPIAVLALAAVCAWAGRPFPADAGEKTRPRQYIVKLRRGFGSASVQAIQANARVQRVLDRLNAILVELPDEVTDRFLASPLVEYYEPNRVRQARAGAPDDPNYSSNQYALQTVQALQAWGLLPNRYLTSATTGSNRIRVAVLDTGADCTHPDFRNQGGSSTDSVAGGQINWALSQALVPTTRPSPACAWQDDDGHGTHTAGTVAAATHNATGVAALGYPLELLIYKVLDQTGSGDDFTISAAIIAAADAGAQVISLSLGGAGYSQSLQDAVNYAARKNALVVAASGNSNSSSLFFPAGANHAVGVAATDSANAKASFSNWGFGVDIAAPGVSILSTYPTYPVTTGAPTNYAYASGTSMAAPHVSALAGLVAMTTPSLAAGAIAQRLQQSASSTIAAGGWHEHVGFGVINAPQSMRGTLRPATVGGVAGQIVDSSELPVALAQITIAGQSVTTNFTGLFRFANLAAGTYDVTVTAPGEPSQLLSVNVLPGADSTLTVRMIESPAQFSGTVSNLGVPVQGAIVQALSGGLVAASAVAGADGAYQLTLPAGTYDLRASAVSYVTTTAPGSSLAPGGSAVVNLNLPRMGQISGTVTGSGGLPVAGAEVVIAGVATTAGAVTDTTGWYSTIGLPAGTYSATVTLGQVSQSLDAVNVADGQTALAAFSFATVDFSVGATPGVQTVTAGSATSFNVTVTAQNGFAGTVNLSASGLPPGVEASFNPSSITGSGSSTATITTTGAVAPNTYPLTLTGTSDALVRSTQVDLTVNAVGGAVDTGTGVDIGNTLPGSSSYASGIHTVSGGGSDIWGGADSFRFHYWALTGDGSITARVMSQTKSSNWAKTGVMIRETLAANSPYAMAAVTPVNGARMQFRPLAGGASQVAYGGTGAAPLWLKVQRAGNLFSMYRSADGATWTQMGGSVTIAMGASVYAGLAVTAQSSLTLSTVNFQNVATEQAVPTGDFSMEATPPAQTVTAGAGTSYTVNLSGQNGFNGAVMLSASGLPPGVGASFNPASITGSGSSTVTITTTGATVPNTYALTFTGTSGTLVHSATVSLTVNAAPDFTMGATPGTQTVIVGSGTSYTVNVTPQNGFDGIVNLSASGLPPGVGASFNPASITGSGSSTVTITTTGATVPNTYALTFTGTSGTLVHTSPVSLTVNAAPDFTFGATPVSQTVTAGMGTSFTVSVVPQNGFNGIVNLSAGSLPPGVEASFNPTSITGSGSSTVTITTTGATVPNTYALTFAGASGALAHATGVSLTVNASLGGFDPGTGVDIGNTLPGSSAYASGAFTVSGGGSDIWGGADSFRFHYWTLTGDGTITARIVSQSKSSNWAKAGVMIRETLSANSAYAMAAVTPVNGARMQYRAAAGGASQSVYGGTGAAPMWLRVQRSGNVFTTYRSANGTTWTQIGGPVTIGMGGSVYVGLAVTAQSTSVLSTVVADNVSH